MEYVKTHMFSGWWTGNIQRRPFVIMVIVVVLSIFLFTSVFVLSMVGAENGVAKWFGMSVTDAQTMLRDALTMPAYIVVFGFEFAVLAVMSALIAKRLRDIGLPGWPIAIALMITGGLLLKETVVIPVVLVVLAVTPSAVFNIKLPPIVGR